MMIYVRPKALKQITISATFEHEGIAYEEKFSSRRRFLAYMKRTKDSFICAVDYQLNLVVNQFNLREYSTV